jgi:hypothetical protein
MPTSEEHQTTMVSRLEFIQQKGIALYLNGHSATPDEIASCCVNEDTVYMPDYVMDEAGKLKEVRYDKITCS